MEKGENTATEIRSPKKRSGWSIFTEEETEGTLLSEDVYSSTTHTRKGRFARVQRLMDAAAVAGSIAFWRSCLHTPHALSALYRNCGRGPDESTGVVG